MRPAYSIIFFTVSSGAGYGLLFVLGVAGLAGVLPAHAGIAALALGLALAFITLGLLASVGHLGHPARMWRAFTQVGSSWLSREAVLAVATYPAAGAFAIGWLFFADAARGRALLDIGFLVAAAVLAALCALTVVATAMIYASLKPVRQWNNAWVPVGYAVLGAATGAVWLFALARLFGETALWMAWLAGALVLGGLLIKLGYWRAIDNAKGTTTAESATALGAHGAVRLLDPPHTEENFVQHEMGYRIARKHARRFRDVAVGAGFLGPLALIALGESLSGWPGALAALLGALLASAGVVIERWLFFAEATHTVALYYGAREA